MALETRPPAVRRFGTFEVDVYAGEVRKQGVRIKLQEQPFHVLTVLLQRSGEVVTREELRSQIWAADTFVDFDNSLNTSINKLREALGDSAENPRFIETLPRRGYRFIAPVTCDNRKESAVANAGWKIAVSLFVVAAALLAGGLFWRTRQGRRLTEKDTIVLADFANTTGDVVFDDTLKQGLHVQLEQSPFLNILSDEKVSDQLPLMGHQKGDRLTKDLARDLCQRVGSKAVLAGSISNLGSRYVIGLNAFNCRSGDVLAREQVEADSREHVLKALGKSATMMREKLGESLATIQKYDAPVEQATTQSLEALQAYSLGLKIFWVKGSAAAVPFFEHAIQLDPTFAMAYARLGTMYDNLDEAKLADQTTRKAYELRQKVGERERLYIESHYFANVTGELDKAVHMYELWLQIYPQDPVPYGNLVNNYAQLGDYEKSLEIAPEALRVQPNEDTYAQVGLYSLLLNRLDEAEAAFKQAEERKLEGEGLLVGRYLLAFLKGDAAEMRRLAASAADKSSAEDQLLFCQAGAEAYHGRRREARELFHRAVESAERNGAMERAAGWQATVAQTEAFFGDRRQARSEAHAALRLAPTRDVQTGAAFAFALAQDIRLAEKLVSELNKSFPLNTRIQRYSLPTIRAAVALERKQADEAIEFLRATSSYEPGAVEASYVRGRAYLALRDGSAATVEFKKIIDHPSFVLTSPLGPLAHLGLARAYGLQSDTAKSRAAYQDFLTLWKDADPDIPILQQAKAEYAKLQ